MEALIESFQTYYGLDWLAFALGVSGAWMITCKQSLGFVLCSVGCLCGFIIALISSQYGFVLSNMCFIMINMRGFFNWSQEEAPVERYQGYQHITAEAAE